MSILSPDGDSGKEVAMSAETRKLIESIGEGFAGMMFVFSPMMMFGLALGLALAFG